MWRSSSAAPCSARPSSSSRRPHRRRARRRRDGRRGRATLRDDLGTLTVTGDHARAGGAALLRPGRALAYAFNHGEAVRAFREAQKTDPDLRHVLLGRGLGAGPEHQLPDAARAVAPAFAAVAQAMALRRGQRAQEQALIEALATRYSRRPGGRPQGARRRLRRRHGQGRGALPRRRPGRRCCSPTR